MKTFRHWQVLEDGATGPDGKPYLLRAWGGSDEDEADALAAAAARLAQMRTNLAARGLTPAAQYEYATGVVREERLEVIAGDERDPAAVITRNRYGAPVLNARRLFIADLDFPPPGKKFWGKAVDPVDAGLERVRAWAAGHAAIALRVYRTPAGLRLIRTDAPMEAVAADAQALLADLGSDPLYRALCRRQECFRARLGPKPWRVDLGSPPDAFPREGKAQARFATWLADYEREARTHAACRFVEALGPAAVAGELEPLIAVHDTRCQAQSGLPLA
jgi:hypothetical protein